MPDSEKTVRVGDSLLPDCDPQPVWDEEDFLAPEDYDCGFDDNAKDDLGGETDDLTHMEAAFVRREAQERKRKAGVPPRKLRPRAKAVQPPAQAPGETPAFIASPKEGETEIAAHAFHGRTDLVSVVIPSSVTSIGDHAFEGCKRLASVVIPDSVQSIGAHAFEYCFSLAFIHLPDGVQSIGDYAFHGCGRLSSVVFPQSVQSIGSFAFWDCWGLTSVVISDCAAHIGSAAFSGCHRLKNMEVSPWNPWYQGRDSMLLSKDGSVLVAFPSAEGDVVLPSGVQRIGDSAFKDCSALTSVVIPDGVQSIGSHAFENCSALTSVVLPSSVQSIGHDAFMACRRLTSVDIPGSVTHIGHDAFRYCAGISSIHLPDGLTSVGHHAFSGCFRLKTFEVSEKNPCYSSRDSMLLSKDGSALLAFPSARGNVSLPFSVTSIGPGAFCNCKGLASVTIPDSVQSISVDAFEGVERIVYSGPASSSNNWGAKRLDNMNSFRAHST